MTIFWAKPNQTYEEHVRATYKSWKEIIKIKRPLIEKWAQIYNFNADRFIKSSLLTVVLHDIGKNIEPFQSMMKNRKNKLPVNYDLNYRHELVSFPFVLEAGIVLNKQEGILSITPIEALAVLSHHKKINTDKYYFRKENSMDRKEIEDKTFNLIVYSEGIDLALKIAEDIFKEEGFIFPTLRNKKFDNYYSRMSIIVDNLFKISNKDDLETIRAKYILLKSILHYSDWYGSSGNSITYSVDPNTNIIQKIEERCKEKSITFKGLTSLQTQCSNTNGNVILIAPTGSGKTEASLLWAMNNLKNRKIIYLLPTMVTANSIYSRLKQFFGNDKVGLTHSTASFVKSSEVEKISPINNLEKMFIKPITIATVDQLLDSGFHGSKWTLKEVNAANSVIIIDEIHSYDPWTLGLILESLKHYSKLGANFIVMSATLPTHLINLIKNALPDSILIEDKELSKECRNSYKVVDKTITEMLPDIEKSVKNGAKTLVIVNTVKKCQTIYDKLAHLNPMCYHSKFIFKDRKEKEKIIDNQILLISTQAVEVSLDIDYDVMFCECAPADAIVQRAGRVNRKRIKNNTEVIICKSETSSLIYDPQIVEQTYNIFKNKGGKISEFGLIEIVENVYSHTKIEESKYFIEASSLYSEIQKKLMGIFDNNNDDRDITTRKSDYIQISVIPMMFKNIVMSLKPNDRKQYEIKIPYWYVKDFKENINGIKFCDMLYDSVSGAKYIDKKDIPNTVIF